MSDILLGYEIPSGEPVSIPLRHTVVTGITQLSGKSTTLEAIISRSGRQAIAFITKRSEGTFQNAPRIEPYFREHTDWQFVSSLLQAMLREKMKFERGWIMRVSKNTHSLEQVHMNIRHQMETAKGLSADIYLQLDEYFNMLLPEIARLRIRMTKGPLILAPGISVMDLHEYREETQALVIASVIEAVYPMKNVSVVIPEAWEMVPQGRGTPVKLAAEKLIRKGASAGNFLFLDSQDLSGLDKAILKQVGVWILGVQGEINEVEHTLAQIPMPRKQKPKPEEIQRLGKGEFFVCFGSTTKKVYVQPAWMDSFDAAGVARGEVKVVTNDPSAWGRNKWPNSAEEIQEDTNVDYKAAYERLANDTAKVIAKSDALYDRVKELEKQLCDARGAAAQPTSDIEEARKTPIVELDHGPGKQWHNLSMEDCVKQVRERLLREPALIKLAMSTPEIEVTVTRETIALDHSTPKGRLAWLISDGFFDTPRTTPDLTPEFRRRGWMAMTGRPIPLGPILCNLTEMGFLTLEEEGYQAVKDMKVRIVER